MSTLYNRIAGQSVERLAALSDGIFAVAMTLLVLELHAPASELIHSEGDLLRTLAHIAPKIVVYMMTFLTLGIFWVGQQTQLNFIERSHRSLTWVHLAFLFGVTLTPFSTALLEDFAHYRSALVVYWFNIFLMGATLFLSWECAEHLHLTKPDMPADVPHGIRGRILIAQSLYAFGALLCLISTNYSVAFIVAVQLYYAIAPRWPGRRGRETMLPSAKE
jgi:uncharacterized membrane protein